MPQDETNKPVDKEKPQAAPEPELDDQDLAKISGGLVNRGGDDDLEDLEVER